MARISRPQIGQASSALGATVSEGLIQSQGSQGTSAIGRSLGGLGRGLQGAPVGVGLRDLGGLIDRHSRRMMEETRATHESAQLNNKLAEATEQFIDNKEQRLQQVTDTKGNPTFTTLTNDIGTIGRKIGQSTTRDIDNPRVSAAFNQKFDSFILNQKISTLRVARKQQIDFGRASVDTGLGTAFKQAINDLPENVAAHEQRGNEILDSALQGGIISAQDHAKMKDSFSLTLREAVLENSIKKDTRKANELLQQDASTLGIKESQKERLVGIRDAKVTSDQIQVQKAANLKKIEDTAKQATLAQELEKRIEADALREDDLLIQERVLEPSTFSALKKKFVSRSKERSKQDKLFQNISNTMASGGSTDTFSPKQVSKYYENLVEGLSQDTDNPLNLSQKAEVAAAFKGKVRPLAKEINAVTLRGSAQDAVQALRGYTFLKDRGSNALDGNLLTSDAEAVLEIAELLTDRGGVSEQDAIREAKASVLDIDDKILKFRADGFRKGFTNAGGEFSTGSLKETTADDLDIENFLQQNKEVSDSVASTYKALVEHAYSQSGNIEGARAIAQTRMQKTHGHTGINGDDEYMFAPIEKEFPGIDVGLARQGLVRENSPFLRSGADPDSIRIVSDAKTKGTFVTGTNEIGEQETKEMVTYAVVYTQETPDGLEIELPVMDEATGIPKRWRPDLDKQIAVAEENLETRKSEELDKLETKGKEFRDRGKPSKEKILRGTDVNILRGL